ncbi:MAG TPA: right-handed parallel beta-helix repeat-containing protein [Lysobacter sp.]
MPSRAAQSYDNCTGFIDSLPATISTQGTWCLRSNVSTAMTSGAAITVATSNVTIDCNDFKVGGLAAGPTTWTYGVLAENRMNVTVRHCNVRGFYIGVSLEGSGGGHLIEDNRLDQNAYGGIYVSGDNSLVQRNRVFDTGGKPGNNTAFGIRATADIIGNTVSGVHAGEAAVLVLGIEVNSEGHEVRGNHVRGLIPGTEGNANAIQANAFGATFTANRVSSDFPGTAGAGIWANGGFCIGNTVRNYQLPYGTCYQDLDNLSLPMAP